MSDVIVNIKQLQVSYGSTVALNGLDLSMRASDGVVGLFGPNGAGKTTLTRVLCSDIERYSGSVSVPARKDVAYLPDSPYLYPWLRVVECIELFEHWYPDFRTDVAWRFLEGSVIDPRRRVKTLSKGMSERLHLALTLAREPSLYLIDEPLAGVDPLTRDHLLNMVQEYRAPGVPLLLCTHLIQDVERIFDAAVLVINGRVVAAGTTAELKCQESGGLESVYKKVIGRYE
ncbi:ABC-2 type transport system ATP-binding protein [Austwickia chelonae]|uniref:Putative ABC transporter ATP-binding protein n=1 Tax=Austwickia chelonae NBRC 105200 TaxID=1184607 RepID=K6VM14_9MICO|nr:ABC transporter ATP-binding protein [Austwickia chelonae]GAB77779.1 putative ABC transporter ATP-binding protein [Austwickia chelonae NBRC 105200]SEV89331.1 ABC-2 type transport system ATP-binding protein [Austwickia chelonae]